MWEIQIWYSKGQDKIEKIFFAWSKDQRPGCTLAEYIKRVFNSFDKEGLSILEAHIWKE